MATNAYTAALLPEYQDISRIGPIPGRKNMFIIGGFTGHGMPQIFLAAKGLSAMLLKDTSFEETGIPNLFRESIVRLENRQNSALDLHRRVQESKLRGQ